MLIVDMIDEETEVVSPASDPTPSESISQDVYKLILLSLLSELNIAISINLIFFSISSLTLYENVFFFTQKL